MCDGGCTDSPTVYVLWSVSLSKVAGPDCPSVCFTSTVEPTWERGRERGGEGGREGRGGREGGREGGEGGEGVR